MMQLKKGGWAFNLAQPPPLFPPMAANNCGGPAFLPEDHGGGLKNLVALLAADKGELEQQQQEQN
jgi:hypothetical protein